MQATLIKKLDGFNGDARLYKVEPQITQLDWDNNEVAKHDYVVVSAADVMFSGPETYIFPADEHGEIVSWRELDGSFKGGLDHIAALARAGYEVTSNAEGKPTPD